MLPPKTLLIPVTDTLYPRRLDGFEVRLALLHQGAWQDSICCTFQYCTLQHEPIDPVLNRNQHFSALSYVWGTSKTRETIQVDGHDLTIGVNLACAIRHLRDERRPILIWIDAICINQDDITERNSQVAMMRHIYARAQRVIVFLGDGAYYRISQDHRKYPPPPPVTFSPAQDASLITHFHKSWETLCTRPEWNSFCTICMLRLLENVEGYKDTIKCISNGKTQSKLRLFELVRQFINSQWWQRVWVVQEITVPSEVVIRYGNVTIPWAILASSANLCEDLGWGRHDLGSEYFLGIEREHAKVLPVFARQVLEIESLRREWKEREGSGLLSLLQEFSGRKATDDRDKVFALLGLASDINTIEPNYSLSTVQVYRNTVIDLIRKSRSLTALSGDMKRKNSGGIPTWIPDWSVPVEEPDRRRMQTVVIPDIGPRWTVEIVDCERTYWGLVAMNMNKLLAEIEARQRRPLPKDVVGGLILFQKLLNSDTDDTELNKEQHLKPLQQEAIYMCSTMYMEFKKNLSKFLSKTPVQRFIQALLSLSRIPSPAGRYTMNIIRWCTRLYCSKVVDLLLRRSQQIEFEQYKKVLSQLSYAERKNTIWHDSLYSHADDIIRNGWTWDEYMRETLPNLVEFIRERILDGSGFTVGDERLFLFLTSEVTTSLEREQILTDSMTFDEASIELEQLRELSHLIDAASEALEFWTRSNILLTEHACESLISYHRNNVNAPEDDYTTLFSNTVIFVGPAGWMRCLRDKCSEPLGYSPPSLENRRDSAHLRWTENENLLHLSSIYHATVGNCSERLITWVDSTSRITTISQWAVFSLRSKTHDFPLRFARSLIGDLFEVSPGKFRELHRPEENGLLRGWFESSLLPRLCAVNTAVNNEQSTWLTDRRVAGDVDLNIQKSFDAEMRLNTEGRVFFTAGDHGMGLGPGSMKAGDEVHTLPGGNKAFVLRPRRADRGTSEVEFEVIGDCFFLTDDLKSSKSEHVSLQGSLPVEILSGLLDKGLESTDIVLC
ncbi:hypothetical protein LB507_011289 [Fusarium sp. FIESC RH6]|nr:hypothetical protein LB507_011289 [Fusarium sp. FIESC RH6]